MGSTSVTPATVDASASSAPAAIDYSDPNWMSNLPISFNPGSYGGVSIPPPAAPVASADGMDPFVGKYKQSDIDKWMAITDPSQYPTNDPAYSAWANDTAYWDKAMAGVDFASIGNQMASEWMKDPNWTMASPVTYGTSGSFQGDWDLYKDQTGKTDLTNGFGVNKATVSNAPQSLIDQAKANPGQFVGQGQGDVGNAYGYVWKNGALHPAVLSGNRGTGLAGAAPFILSMVAPGVGTAIGSALGAGATLAPVVGGAILGGGTAALTGGDVLKGAALGGIGGAGGTQIGDTGVSLGQVNAGINVAKNLENGNLLGALTGAANLTGASNTQVGDTGFTIGELVKDAKLAAAVISGNPQALMGALTSVVKDISNSSSDAAKAIAPYFQTGAGTGALPADATSTQADAGALSTATDSTGVAAADNTGDNTQEIVVSAPRVDYSGITGDLANRDTGATDNTGDNTQEIVVNAPRVDYSGITGDLANRDTGATDNTGVTDNTQEIVITAPRVDYSSITGDLANRDTGAGVDYSGITGDLANQDTGRTAVTTTSSTPVVTGSTTLAAAPTAPAAPSSGLKQSTASSSGALPGDLQGTALAPGALGQQGNFMKDLAQLYPQLANVDPHLLSILSGKANESALAKPQTQPQQQETVPQQQSATSKLLSPIGESNALMSTGLKLLGGTGSLGAFARGGQVASSNTGPLSQHVPQFITGKTGNYVQGAGDGQSDDIPAMLADGEYVFDADIVAALGNGSNKAGARVLDKMREEIRKHKRAAHVGKIPPPAKSPLEYLKG